MAEWVKTPATKPDDPSWDPHGRKREPTPTSSSWKQNWKKKEKVLLSKLGFFFSNLVELELPSDWLMCTRSHTARMHKYVCMHKQMICNKMIIIKEKEVI